MRTRRLPLVSLILILIALPAAAAPQSPVADRDARIISAIFDFMTALRGKLVSIWEKEGSAVDPFGVRGTTPAPPPPGNSAGEEGSAVDPFGKL
jgi:hypothetical protein